MSKDIIYYLVLAANFLFNFAFIPLLFEILQQKTTSNIPYVSLICFLISQLLFLFVVFYKDYYFHIFLYLVGFICIVSILFLKKFYDNKNIHVIQKFDTSEEN